MSLGYSRLAVTRRAIADPTRVKGAYDVPATRPHISIISSLVSFCFAHISCKQAQNGTNTQVYPCKIRAVILAYQQCLGDAEASRDIGPNSHRAPPAAIGRRGNIRDCQSWWARQGHPPLPEMPFPIGFALLVKGTDVPLKRLSSLSLTYVQPLSADLASRT